MGFQKENVHFQLGSFDDPSQEVLRIRAWDISAHFRNLKVAVQQQSMPYLSAECMADAKAEGMQLILAFKIVREEGQDTGGLEEKDDESRGGGSGSDRVQRYNPPPRDGASVTETTPSKQPAVENMRVELSSSEVLMDNL